MLLHKAILLFLGNPAAAGRVQSGAQMGQRQIIQRGQVQGVGIADVQHFQTFTVCQRREVLNILAEGDFQELQLLAVFKGRQILDGRTGYDDVFQVGHSRHKGNCVQEFIVADVHKLHIFTVNQVMAVIIYQAVHSPDGLSIRQAAAALAEVHPPDHLGFVPVVVPDFGQNIIGHLAVFQHEAAAILHQVQRKAHFLFPFVADFRILDVHFLVGGGDGLAKEVKAVMEFYLRSGVHQGFDVLLGQLADAFGVVQLHTFQVWQHSQLFRYLPDAIGGQGG